MLRSSLLEHCSSKLMHSCRGAPSPPSSLAPGVLPRSWYWEPLELGDSCTGTGAGAGRGQGRSAHAAAGGDCGGAAQKQDDSQRPPCSAIYPLPALVLQSFPPNPHVHVPPSLALTFATPALPFVVASPW